MKIQTFTVVAGSAACNARCPFCISRQTPNSGVPTKQPEVNWRNLQIGIRIAQQHNVTTALITGKGEPTLFPDQLNQYAQRLAEGFPIVELQTNGLVFQQPEWRERLEFLYNAGVTTIALSVVHWENEINRKIYAPHWAEYPDLATTIALLHEIGFSVRLTLMMASPYFVDFADVNMLMRFVKANKVEQTTLRPVLLAQSNGDEEIKAWSDKHILTEDQLFGITNHIELNGTRVMTLPHGAQIYDFGGQNLALTDCLTIKEDTDDLRQLIFFPDGALRYDWQYEGARIL